MKRRPGFVLMAVLVVVAASVLTVLGMLWLVRAEVAGAAVLEQSAQSRCLAWSGLQLVAARIDEQRSRILDGLPPTVDRQYVIYETGSRVGVVRLLPVEPGGGLLAAQAGRLDLNRADEAMLVATGLVDEELAAAIVRHRDDRLGGAFQSEIELLDVAGVTPELLYGSLEGITDAWAQAAEELDRADDSIGGPDPTERRGLMDVCTVYGFEPMLQRDGRLRINFNVPWSEELGERIDGRFGEGSSQIVKTLMDDGTAFDSDSVLVRTLRELDVPPADWGEILDAITSESGVYHGGRLDLNTAPYEALLTLDDLAPETAAAIVRQRESLDAEERPYATWPVVRELMDEAQFEALAGRLTVRSWCWRLRLVAGEVEGGDPNGPLINPVAWEAVVDLSGPSMRFAYLREITLLPVAALLLLDRSDAEIAMDAERAAAGEESAPVETGDDEDSTGIDGGIELDPLSFGGLTFDELDVSGGADGAGGAGGGDGEGSATDPDGMDGGGAGSTPRGTNTVRPVGRYR